MQVTYYILQHSALVLQNLGLTSKIIIINILRLFYLKYLNYLGKDEVFNDRISGTQ